MPSPPPKKRRAPHRPAASPPAKPRSRLRTGAATLAVFVLVVGAILLAGSWIQIGHLIDSRQAAMSSSILSAPHRLRAGDDVVRSRLEKRLEAQRYVRMEAVREPGEYAKTGDAISIWLRGFRWGAARVEPRRVTVRLRDGRIASVTDDSGAAVGDAMLEPEAIGRLVPGAPAERVEIRLEDQKPYLVEGLLATEDYWFYWHPGFNPVRIAKVVVQNVQAKRLAAGASTLTQQLARTFLERRDRSFERKLRELLVALVLEVRFTKPQILERYINDVSLGAFEGAPINGMPQAARYFFNKDLSRVTPAEAATLIGMVQAPTLFDPRRHPEACKRRRDTVLAIMKREGILDEAAYAAAVATPVEVVKTAGLRRAPYFTDYVTSELARAGVGGDLAGLRVYTTLDTEMQADAVSAVRANLEKLEKTYASLRRDKATRLQSAAVVLDAPSGAVRAMVGGRDYANSQFNRAASALRQPGSAFKPLVYMAALDPKRSPVRPALTLASLLPNERLSFDGWTPENYDKSYESPVTVIDAISRSHNVPAVFVGSRLGAARIVRTAHELGIDEDLQPYLPIAIGAGETTLLELSSAYQAFASGGLHQRPWAIASVVDADGRELYRHEDRTQRVTDPAVAYLVTTALRSVMQSGTAASSSSLGLDVPAAGKTGTTQDYRDALFVGYTPSTVAAVWVGFDNPRSVGLTGAQAALPAWIRIVQGAATADRSEFVVPPGIETAVIDPASGGLATEDCRRRVKLPFLAGTAPQDLCPLHGGAGYASASRNWGGWQSSRPPAAVAASRHEEPPAKKPNVFRRVGGFFGKIFRKD